MLRLVYFFSALYFLTFSVFASELQLKGEMTQGSLIRGQVPVGHQVWGSFSCVANAVPKGMVVNRH